MNDNNKNDWIHFTKKFQQGPFIEKFMDQSSLFQKQILHQKETFPLCDVYQHGECLYVEVELPGLSLDEIRVTLDDQKLIIKGDYHTLHASCQYYVKERNSKKFEKEIHLPFPVSNMKIRHYFQNGLLKIVLPIENKNIDE